MEASTSCFSKDWYRTWILILASGMIMAVIAVGQSLVIIAVYWAVPALSLDGITFQYSMWQSITSLYEHKLYAIALLLLAWSGIWPHFKLIMVVTINLMKGCCSSLTRLSCLEWLSSFGKWSFVDVWVISILVLAIRLNEESFPGLDVSFWVQAVGGNGVYVFYMAIMISQVLSSIVIFQERALIQAEALQQGGTITAYSDDAGSSTAPKTSLWTSEKNKTLRYIFAILVGITFIFVIVSVFIPSYRLTYTNRITNGVLGQKDLSLFTGFLRVGVQHHVGQSNKFLAVIGMIHVIILPIVEVVLMVVVSFGVMSTSIRMILHSTLEKVAMWSSIDAFLFSLILVIIELGPLLKESPLNDFVGIDLVPLQAMYFCVISSLLCLPVRWLVMVKHKAFIDGSAMYSPLVSNSYFDDDYISPI